MANKISWDDFFESHYDWSTSTIKSRMYSIENFNDASTDEILEFVWNVDDDNIKNYVVKKFLETGNPISKEQYFELGYEVGFDIVGKRLERDKIKLSVDEIEEISFEYDFESDLYDIEYEEDDTYYEDYDDVVYEIENKKAPKYKKSGKKERLSLLEIIGSLYLIDKLADLIFGKKD